MMKATLALDSPFTPAEGDWASLTEERFKGNDMDRNVECLADFCSKPDIQVATQFPASEINWQGRQYKMVWQKLINPEKLQTDIIIE